MPGQAFKYIALTILLCSHPWLVESTYCIHSDPRKFIIAAIDSLNNQAETYGMYNLQGLKSFAERALKLANQIDYQEGVEKAKFLLSIYEASKEHYSIALDLMYHYLDYLRSKQDLSGQVMVCIKIALLYLEIQNFELSFTYCINAIESGIKSGDSYDLASAYLSLATYYYQKKVPEKAFLSADTALSYAVLAGDQLIIARLETLLGDIYIEKGNLNLSQTQYRKALTTFTVLGNSTEEAIVLTRIAHVLQLQGKLPEALDFSRKVLEIRIMLDNVEYLSHAYINLGNTFNYCGVRDSALYYYRKGLAMAYLSGNLTAIEYATWNLFGFYNKQNYPQEALNYLQEYQKVHEKVLLEKSNSEINAIEYKYLEKEKAAQIQILQKENEIHRLSLKNRSYSEFITQLIVILAGIIITITIYVIEKNKLGRSKLKQINETLKQEIRERTQTEYLLKQSEQLYRFVTDNTLDLIVRMNRKFNYLFISPAIYRMFGFDPGTPVLPPLTEIIHQEFHDELWSQYREMIHTHKPVILTHLSVRKDGSTFWAESLVNPIFDAKTGKLKETITVVRDISDRIAYEKALADNARQKEVLLREIHHRVKNNFAILISLMNMQKVSANPKNFQVFLTELQGRIRTMSLVHELLYRSHNLDHIEFGEYLHQLTDIISSAFKKRPITLHTTFTGCIVNVETALPLGLVSNEILTNAFKYAFPNGEEGELWIELLRLDPGERKKNSFSHKLVIRDNGKGLPEGFVLENQPSMGSQIITLLVEQIEGKLTYSGKGGASFTIYFSQMAHS